MKEYRHESENIHKKNEEVLELQEQIKQKFRDKRGYWSEGIWSSMLNLDPYFLEQYLDFSLVPFEKKHISLKDKELIYIAFDVSATHMYEPGTQAHMENALEYGATTEEILEVIEIASLLGMQTFHFGGPILIDELEKIGMNVSQDLSEQQLKMKNSFIEKHGYWDEIWDAPLRLSPQIFSAYLGLSTVPLKHGQLTQKMRQFVSLAVDSASTHLNEKGMRMHIRNALEFGASKEEITEVFELVSTLGIHAATTSVPILEKVLQLREK
ncbi:carboxymuconolactone decarboxylase family protein [Salipaludibacillus keqinensis]|nr:carboxymuconolactone decarboxylase family protein [Salipaludibacillus keqinensis]